MSQKIVTKTATSLLLLFLLLPSSSSLPLILSEFLPSPQPSTMETTSPPSSDSSDPSDPSSDPSDPSSKFSSSVSAIGNLLSNKANFLGDQSSLLGHQMEMLEKVYFKGHIFYPVQKRFFWHHFSLLHLCYYIFNTLWGPSKELSERLAGLEEQLETKKEEEHELRERLQGLKSQDDFYTVG